MIGGELQEDEVSGRAAPSGPAVTAPAMGVYWVSGAGLERRDVADLLTLLAREDGFVWVDAPACDEATSRVLLDVFGFHPLAVQDCSAPSPVPRLHAYPDYVFVVLHAPQVAGGARLEHVELDQFIGRRYLVTVHEPSDRGAPSEATIAETRAVRDRVVAGRFHPASPFDLSYAIVTGLARQMETLVWTLAHRVNTLERQVLEAASLHPRKSRSTVDELFRTRHELLTLQTMAAENGVVYARIVALARFVPPEAREGIEDLRDQFDRVAAMCEGQSRFLQEVLDFYQTRIATELNEFVKRLTALGTIFVFATVVAGIYGMNFENMPELKWTFGYPFALGVMVVCGGGLAWWFHRKGWL